MVRVISCYHFASQRVEGGDGYIVSLCHIPPGRLCLAFPWKLEIWDLTPKLKRFTTFPVVGGVQAVDYSEKGKYLATLESVSNHQDESPSKFCVRVYASWDDSPEIQFDGASVASSYEAGSARSPGNRRSRSPELEVIELPRAGESVESFSTCPATGNIAAAYKTHVAIYKLKKLWDSAAGYPILDFVLFLTVVPNFSPRKIILRENILACMSPAFAHVYQIGFVGPHRAGREQQKASSPAKGEVVGERNCSLCRDLLVEVTCVDRNQETVIDCSMLSSAGGRSMLDVANEATSNSSLFGNNFSRVPWHEAWWAVDDSAEPSGSDSQLFSTPELLGPVIDPNSPTVTLMGQYAEEAEANDMKVHVTTLLRIGPVATPAATPSEQPGMAPTGANWEQQGSTEEEYDRCIRDIILRATYIPGYHPSLFEGKVPSDLDQDTNTSEDRHESLTLASEDMASLIGMEFAVCYEQEAHFYVWLMGSGSEGMVEDVKKLNPHGRLPFTAPYRGGVMLHNSFHVCTSTGLETFALQSARPILRQYLRSIFPRLSSWGPNPDETIHLLGLHPFLQVGKLIACPVSPDKSFLVLTSMSDSPQKPNWDDLDDVSDKWTMYVLELPGVKMLCDDLRDAIRTQKDDDSDLARELVREGHVTLGWLGIMARSSYASKRRGSLSPTILSRLPTSVFDLWAESCSRLAWSALTENPEASFCYLKMSGLRPKPLLERIEARAAQNPSEARALDALALRLMDDLFLPAGVSRPQDVIVWDDVEAALKVYSKAGSWKLAEAILSSPAMLGDGKADRLGKVMDALTMQVARLKECSVTEVLAAVLLLLVTGRESQAGKMLAIPSTTRLLGTLTKNYHFLLRRHGSEYRPTLLLKVLVVIQPGLLYQTLVRVGLAQTAMVPKIFQCVKYLAQDDTTIPWNVSSFNSALLEAAPQEYLEVYFKTAAHHCHLPVGVEKDYIHWLVTRYLDHLCSEKQSPISEIAKYSVNRNKKTLFGSRPAFLDFLPPFDTSGGVVDTCRLPEMGATGGGDASKNKEKGGKPSGKTRSKDSNEEEEKDGGAMEFERENFCPCCVCNSQLLGLQSLLWSRLVGQEEKNIVKDRAPDIPEHRGRISLLISCSHPAAAVATLAVHAPLALAAYAAANSEVPVSVWKDTAMTLFVKYRGEDDDDVKRVLERSLKDLLVFLSTKMPPNDMKRILPPDLDPSEHEALLMRSYCADWAEDVADLIGDLGENLGTPQFLTAVFPRQAGDVM